LNYFCYFKFVSRKTFIFTTGWENDSKPTYTLHFCSRLTTTDLKEANRMHWFLFLLKQDCSWYGRRVKKCLSRSTKQLSEWATYQRGRECEKNFEEKLLTDCNILRFFDRAFMVVKDYLMKDLSHINEFLSPSRDGLLTISRSIEHRQCRMQFFFYTFLPSYCEWCCCYYAVSRLKLSL
jgi:hypothetical protein